MVACLWNNFPITDMDKFALRFAAVFSVIEKMAKIGRMCLPDILWPVGKFFNILR